MTSDLEQFRHEMYALKDDIELALQRNRDIPSPSVSKLMIDIKNEIARLNDRLKPLEDWYQRTLGMGIVAKVGWSIVSVYVIASSFGIFQMYVKVSHIDQDIRLTIQEELRK